MATAVGDASAEARYEYRGLRRFVNFGNEVGVGSQSTDLGSMELAMEVTAELACSQAKRRNQYLQELVCTASEALDRATQCSWRSKVEVEVDEQEVCHSKGKQASLEVMSCPCNRTYLVVRNSGTVN